MKVFFTMGKTANNHIVKYIEENSQYDISSGLFDRFYDEILFGTEKFDIIHLHESSIQIYLQQPEQFAENMQIFLERIKSIIQNMDGGNLVLNTFEYIPIRMYGNMDSIQENGIINIIDNANSTVKMLAKENANVHLCDVQYLTNWFGLENTFNLNLIDNASYNGSLQFQIEQAKQLIQIIDAINHKSGKLLISDLDNTFWGGIIGDVGFENTIDKKAIFKAYRAYILSLKNQGVFTAVSSKNNDTIMNVTEVKELIDKYFVLTKINWEQKSLNIKEIINAFNISEDAAVFVDDNIREIEEVKINVETKNIHFMNKIETFKNLFLYNAFEKTTLTQNDTERIEQFTRNMKVLENAGSYEEYLESLNIKIDFESIDLKNENLARVIQLFNKTNQFNNYKESITDNMISDYLASGYMIYTVHYEDKFGSEKNIAALICKKEEDVVTINNWVMSCRVFKRGIEQETLKMLSNQNEKVKIRFKPSEKNLYLQNFLETQDIELV